jgi:hypothetical protein
LNDPWEELFVLKEFLHLKRFRADHCLRISTTVFIIYVPVEIGFEALLVSDGIVQLLPHLTSRVRPPRLTITWACGNQIVNES